MAKIVIRSTRDRSRYMGQRGWVISKRRARNFLSTYAAMFFCLEHDLDESEVVVQFPESNAANVVIALPAEISRPCYAGEVLSDTDPMYAVA